MSFNQGLKAGCYGYAESGHLANPQEIELPLKRLFYDIELTDSLAFLELEQIYVNGSKSMLDVQYVFPVNARAAIHNFQVSFGGKTVIGVVKSRQEAEKQFKENQEERRGVGYGGYYSSSARDIMKVKLGNIMPGQEIRIKMSYIHTVSVVLNTFYEFKLTTSITPRYASALQPHQIIFKEKFDKSMEGLCSWFLRIKIKSSRKLKSFFSKTHKISSQLKKVSSDTWEVQILEEGMLPNKDFMLTYSFVDMDKPSVLVGESDNCTEAVVSFVPKFCTLDQEHAKQYALQQKEVSPPMSKIKAEYIFFLDRSGSMSGERIGKATQSLIIFLKSLPQDSFFNVISFGNDFELLFPSSQKYTKEIIQQSVDKIQVMEADLGGTQIYEPLKQCLSWPPIENYPRHIFLLTDGAIQNTSNVLAYVSTHIQYSRVHSIGIGNGASEDLIMGCAQQGKGYSVMISDEEDPTDKIIEILDKSLSPLISKLHLTYDKSKVQSVVPNPEKNPYLLKNEVANFYFTFNGRLKEPMPVLISYTDSMGLSYSQKVVVDPTSNPRCQFLTKMVNFVNLNALYTMYKYGESQQDHFFYVKQINKQELQKKIIKESVEKQILTELTAYICVDKSLSDEFLKSKLREEKTSIKINPMNPVGHINGLNVFFGNEELDGSDGDIYEDECAIGSYHEEAFEVNNNKSGKKILKTNKKNGGKTKMKIIDLKKKRYVHVEGGNSSEKQLFQMITCQDVNGMWSGEEVLKKFFSFKEIQEINRVFGSLVSRDVMTTLAIIQQIKTFHAAELKKMTLILRKAQEFIMSNSSKTFEELQKIWGENVRPIS